VSHCFSVDQYPELAVASLDQLDVCREAPAKPRRHAHGVESRDSLAQ